MTFVLDVLAAYRVTRLIVEDEITADLRELVWKRFSPEDTKIGYALTCPHCASVWIAALVAAAHAFAPKTTQPAVNVLALAGAVSLVNDARAWADVVG